MDHGDAAQDLIESAVRRVALVAGVVADDEQAADDKTCGQTTQQLGPPGLKGHRAHNQGGKNRPVQREQGDAQRGAAFSDGSEPAANDFAVRQGGVLGNGLRLFKPGGILGHDDPDNQRIHGAPAKGGHAKADGRHQRLTPP